MTTQPPPIPDFNRLLDGKVAVVTGAGAGIGAAIASLFASHGALVEGAEIDPARAGEGMHVVDVTSESGVAQLADAVLTKHGRVDVIVNNVGDYRPPATFEQSSPTTWMTMYEKNVLHVFAVTRAFLPTMISQGSGAIVNVHSVEGMRAYPGDPVYASMKAAAAHFTTSLAVWVGRHGIRVNGIGPDLTQTPQVDYLTGWEDHAALWESWAPVGRVGWPEDQARVALFLASDLSSYVTGHNVPVDGGTKAGGAWIWSPKEGRFVNRSKHL